MHRAAHASSDTDECRCCCSDQPINPSQGALTQRIVDARKKLKSVQIPYEFRVKISAICSELNVDGIRGDIVTNRAAKALASFEGRDEVAVEDIYRCVHVLVELPCQGL